MFARRYAETGGSFRGFPVEPQGFRLPNWYLKFLAAMLIWTGMVLPSNGVPVVAGVVMIVAGVVLLVAGLGLPGSGLRDFREPPTDSANV